MATMIDVEVLELCTRTVTKTPIIKPHTGLLSRKWLLSTSPAARPPNNLNAELRKSNEQMKKYMEQMSRIILTMVPMMNRTRLELDRATYKLSYLNIKYQTFYVLFQTIQYKYVDSHS